MEERPLTGGRVTEGVVRVGDTVRRPAKRGSTLLTILHERGFHDCPRYLGIDEQGRAILSFVEGEVPAELGPDFSDEVLAAAARLIRRFHDATGGTVCHNDISPCNTVFRDGMPVALIDFDRAAPGDVRGDVGYAVFLWLNLGTDGPPAEEQARRVRVFCRAYGAEPDVDAVIEAVAANTERLRASGRDTDAAWWSRQLRWLDEHRADLGG